jgi:hypothetical protein
LGEPPRSLPVPQPGGLPGLLVSRISNLRITKALDIFMRALDIGNRQVAELRLALEKPDVVIRPDVRNIGLLERVNVHEVTLLGEAATRAALPELKRATSWSRRLRRRFLRADA